MDALRVGMAGWITVTMKLWLALWMGTPLSETVTVTIGVEGDCAMVGRQVNKPLLESMEAPVGGFNKPKVKGSGGKLGSLAELVTCNVRPARMVWLEIAASM